MPPPQDEDEDLMPRGVEIEDSMPPSGEQDAVPAIRDEDSMSAIRDEDSMSALEIGEMEPLSENGDQEVPAGAEDPVLASEDRDSAAPAPGPEDFERMVEALLFASAEPLSTRELESALPDGCDTRAVLEALQERYAGRGVNLRRAGAGWVFRTAPDLGWLFERAETRERRLSRAALETLAIIAYHQPVSRAEIEEIRGVAVSRGTVNTLMEMGWVGLGRRRRSPGRPTTYIVTDGFLDHFGLESARDLPGIKELKALGLLERPAVAVAAAKEEGQAETEEQAEEA